MTTSDVCALPVLREVRLQAMCGRLVDPEIVERLVEALEDRVREDDSGTKEELQELKLANEQLEDELKGAEDRADKLKTLLDEAQGFLRRLGGDASAIAERCEATA